MDGHIISAALPAWVPRRALDVETYHGMAAAGLLRREDRVELIEGELVWMSPAGVPHIGTVMALTRIFATQVADRAEVLVQMPVRLDRFNEPEPDIALLRPRDDRYLAGEPPGGGDVLLLVEVSKTSLRMDREVKAPLYARFGIPEYWIVDLTRRLVILHRSPTTEGYADEREAKASEIIAPHLLPNVQVPLTQFLK